MSEVQSNWVGPAENQYPNQPLGGYIPCLMVYGREWTGERVQARLREAFRRLPDTPIWSPQRNELRSAFGVGPIDGADLIVATATCLGRGSKLRIELLAHCRAKATAVHIRRLCHGYGWPRTGHYRRVRRAAQEVADCLNRRGDDGHSIMSADTYHPMDSETLREAVCGC